MDETMHDELWAGVDLKAQYAEFFLQEMSNALRPQGASMFSYLTSGILRILPQCSVTIRAARPSRDGDSGESRQGGQRPDPCVALDHGVLHF